MIFNQVYGGTGFLKRVQRVGWDIYTTVYVSSSYFNQLAFSAIYL